MIIKIINGVMIGVISILLVLLVVIVYNQPIVEPIIPTIPTFPSTIPGDDVDNGNITLHIDWNIVSMPNSIPKENISFTYQGIPYSWDEAVANEYIWNVLWGFNGTDYVMVDYCIKTKGYWLCSRVDELYIHDEPLVICGNALWTNGTEDIVCNNIIISNLYDSPICVNTITYDSIEFYYLSDGVLGE